MMETFNAVAVNEVFEFGLGTEPWCTAAQAAQLANRFRQLIVRGESFLTRNGHVCREPEIVEIVRRLPSLVGE